MRKEVIFAIIIGLILGLVILYGVQLANKSANQAAGTVSTPTPAETLTATPTIIAELTVTSPSDHAVVNTATIKIIGKTTPDASVAIYSSEDDALVTADKDGNFVSDLKLTGGENIITITSLKLDQTTQTIQISIVYSTAKL